MDINCQALLSETGENEWSHRADQTIESNKNIGLVAILQPKYKNIKF